MKRGYLGGFALGVLLVVVLVACGSTATQGQPNSQRIAQQRQFYRMNQPKAQVL